MDLIKANQSKLQVKTTTSVTLLLKETEAISVNNRIADLSGKPVSSLVVQGEKTACYDFIMLIILDVLDFYNSDWTVKQLNMAAKIMYDNYYYWSNAEYKLFSLRCLSAFYEKKNFDFNVSNLVEWAKLFDIERTETFADKRMQDNIINKNDNRKHDKISLYEKFNKNE